MKNKIIYLILTLLGFGSIVSSGCERIGADEYGSPHANFEIKGAVTNAATKKPIKGISISVTYHDGEYNLNNNPYYTDENGNYSLHETIEDFASDMILELKATDEDGELNGGHFESKVIQIKVKKDDFRGGKNWYEGLVSKEVNIQMKTTDNTDN